MDIRKLQRTIVDGLEDVKGQNIVVFNTEHLSALFERVVIASGTSNRQTKALAASVRDAVKTKGFGPTRTEGEENGEWIIVDCGAAVVHLMQPSIREYYHLEEIWGDKPVKIKLDNAAPRLVKASEPELPARKPAPVKKKPVASRSPPMKTIARKSPPRKAVVTPPARGPAAKRAAPEKKTTAAKKLPARKAVTRTVGTRSAVAGAAASKKSIGSRTPPAKSASSAIGKTRRKA